MGKWQKTQYPGVRFRVHDTRKHNGKLDRYFVIRYKRQGKSIEEPTGWASQGMNAQKSNEIRSGLVQNIRQGQRPQSLKEKREMEQARRDAELAQAKKEEMEMYTFGELAEKYIEFANSSKKSWKDDEQRYNTHLKPHLADLPLKDISPLHLERLKRELQKKKVVKIKKGKKITRVAQDYCLSPATVKHCLVLVRQMFNKAIAWGLFSGVNPVKKIKLPSPNNKRMRFLSHEEADKLLALLKDKSRQVHDEALLSIHCGLRFGEIAALVWADLDFQNEIIHIRDPKGNKREAFMTPEVKEMFTFRLPESPKPNVLVFPDNKSGRKQKSVSRTFDDTVKDLKFNKDIEDRRDKVVFHSLRHSFASWLAIQGTPLYTIKELMGHKTLAMTERYAHLIPDHKRQAVKDLAGKFRQAQANRKVVTVGSTK